jgi:hypothetical protein
VLLKAVLQVGLLHHVAYRIAHPVSWLMVESLMTEKWERLKQEQKKPGFVPFFISYR